MKVALGLLGAAFLFGATFLGLYLFRAELYAVTEIEAATRAQLYPVSPTAAAVAGYRTEPGPVLVPALRNADHCSGWDVDSADTSVRVEGPLRIPLRPGSHDYVARPSGCTITEPAVDAVRFNLLFGEASTFGAQDLAADQYQVNSVNLPTVLADPTPFSRWVPNVTAASPAEAAEARQALTAAGFDFGAPTRERIAFLAAFVRRHVPSGSPPPYLNEISPWQVFLEGDRKGVGGFCRQWSLTYGFLANVAGIATRNLFTGGAMDAVDMGSHAFSESYVPEEARWAFVDPTNDIAYVTDPGGRVVNGADVYAALLAGTEGPLTAYALTADGVAPVPFSGVAQNVRHFMHPDNFLIYVGSDDGRYQLQGTGPQRYLRQLYRFLFQPQQYFGHTHFVSYPWVRPAVFFAFLFFALIGSAAGGAVLIRRRR